MRAIGLDLGSKTIGIARSDLLKMVANPVETYRFDEDDYDQALQYVLKFIDENEVDEVILGLPKHMNGDIGVRAEISQSFKDALVEANNHIKVILWDERMSTISANRVLLSANTSRNKRKKVIDKMAAVIILQSYLDSK